MIKYLSIKNLNGFTEFTNDFFKDVNIITGVNGSGKTSVLRLAWYLNSANMERIFDDSTFDELSIETTRFNFAVKCEKKNKKIEKIKISYSDAKNKNIEKEVADADFRRVVEDFNIKTLESKVSKPTAMFPTFRRIEGGFSYLNQKPSKTGIAVDKDLKDLKDPIEYGLEKLSRRLGVQMHRFVSTLSTNDIKDLLTKSYADISHQTNELHAQMAMDVTAMIEKYRTSKTRKKEGGYIDKIAAKVDEISTTQKEKLAPFNVLQKIVTEFYSAKSIKISDSIIFGSNNNILDSDLLSSGEKQLLGFLAYNALINNGAIFIDEPELSLHIDWQRKLIKTLIEQNPSNQLIMATHSPFIYSLYEDRELKFKDQK